MDIELNSGGTFFYLLLLQTFEGPWTRDTRDSRDAVTPIHQHCMPSFKSDD